jgi:hypothetical protein
MGVHILYLDKRKGARKVDEGVFLVYLEKREGWAGRVYSEAPGRTIGTVTVSCGDRAMPCKDGARRRRSRIKLPDGAGGRPRKLSGDSRRRVRGTYGSGGRRRQEGVENASSENGECVTVGGSSTSAEPQIRSDSEGSEKEAEAPITALKWSGERRDEVEKDGVGYTKLHRIQ